MGWKFNPFTGALDQTGSTPASYIDGEVATYNDLPLSSTTAPLDSAWLVRSSSGVWPFTKPGGVYVRTATGGSSRDADYTYAGVFPDVFSDANFTLYDDADTSKNLKFQLSGITTGTTRTLTAPNASGTIARTEDFAAPPAIGSTTAASGAFTTLSANNGTITASAPVLDLLQTWNNAAVTFTGLKFNVTATAAASNSMFADIQAGGYSQFAITRISSTSNAVWVYNTNSGTNTNGVGANYERGFVRWSSNVFQIGNEAAGTGSTRHCAIVAGPNSYIFYNNGEAVSPLSWVANNSGALRFDTRARIASPADSILRLTNNAATDFDRLQFGGTTSSFPALKRSSTALQVRLADDTAYSVLDAQHRLQGTAPASATATGTAGDIRYDGSYIYVCSATNTWVRAALATW